MCSEVSPCAFQTRTHLFPRGKTHSLILHWTSCPSQTRRPPSVSPGQPPTPPLPRPALPPGGPIGKGSNTAFPPSSKVKGGGPSIHRLGESPLVSGNRPPGSLRREWRWVWSPWESPSSTIVLGILKNQLGTDALSPHISLPPASQPFPLIWVLSYQLSPPLPIGASGVRAAPPATWGRG